jgi:hypothetical protein
VEENNLKEICNGCFVVEAKIAPHRAVSIDNGFRHFGENPFFPHFNCQKVKQKVLQSK